MPTRHTITLGSKVANSATGRLGQAWPRPLLIMIGALVLFVCSDAFAVPKTREKPDAFALVERLERAPSVDDMFRLAEMGPKAAFAVGTVENLLDNRDWEIRVAAARTLGFLGDPSAVDSLIGLLNDPTDMRLNWAAAVSLGMLQSQSAVPALEATAANHWYPSVRQAAAQALDVISNGLPLETSEWSPYSLERFSQYEHTGGATAFCKSSSVKTVPEVGKRYARDDPTLKQEVMFDFDVTEKVLPDSAAQSTDDSMVTPEEEVIHTGRDFLQASVALRVDGGWLAGNDQGVWRGALAFVRDDGGFQVIVDENVIDVHRLGDHFILLAGFTHLFTNLGYVYRVNKGPDNRWTATLWRNLPSAPYRSRVTSDGSVLIDFDPGGTMLLSPDGTFQMVACDNGGEQEVTDAEP